MDYNTVWRRDRPNAGGDIAGLLPNASTSVHSRPAFYLTAWASDDPDVVRDRLDRISRTAEAVIGALAD